MHYHGTPITPITALYELAGRCFCVSHAAPQDVERCHQIGQSVMLDNGAFSKWKSGKETNWTAFYAWAEKWLTYPTTWAVVPDEIDAGSQAQDALIREWPFKERGAPVWHMDEPIDRLFRLASCRGFTCCAGCSAPACVGRSLRSIAPTSRRTITARRTRLARWLIAGTQCSASREQSRMKCRRKCSYLQGLRLKLMYERGDSRNAIAAEFGIHPRTVVRTARAVGAQPRPAGRPRSTFSEGER